MHLIPAQIRVYLRTLLPVFFLTTILCGSALADGEISMFRYVSKKTGREVYAARTAQRKVMDDKAAAGGWLVQQVGYVYGEQRSGTTALYGLILMEPGGAPARVLFTFSEVEYKNLTSPSSPKKWKPYFADSPVVAYVLLDGGDNRIGAYYFTTKGSGPEDDPRIRFTGGEYEKWKGFPGTEYFTGPSFYIFKEKPAGAVTEPPKKLDQILRQMIFVLGKDSIFNALAPVATPKSPLVVKAANAKSCDAGGCTFNFGLQVYRTIAGNYLSTYVGMKGPDGANVSNSTSWSGDQKTQSMVLPMRIPYGKSSITVNLKPYLPKDDANGANNAFTASIILKK